MHKTKARKSVDETASLGKLFHSGTDAYIKRDHCNEQKGF